MGQSDQKTRTNRMKSEENEKEDEEQSAIGIGIGMGREALELYREILSAVLSLELSIAHENSRIRRLLCDRLHQFLTLPQRVYCTGQTFIA